MHNHFTMSGSAALLVVTVLTAGGASAHPGGPASIARPLGPNGITIADQSYLIQWVDSEESHTFVPATIDWYYTAMPPATAGDGAWPPGLEGTLIAAGIEQADPVNALSWDTSDVPPGTYWIYSITTDIPFTWVAFSPGVLTVAHPGDPVHPAVIVTDPDSPNDESDTSFVVRYSATDPDGTATVRLDAIPTWAASEAQALATGLPAVADGALTWETADLDEGQWTVRATITDARGLTSTAYATAFLSIRHGAGSPPQVDQPATDGARDIDTPAGCSSAPSSRPGTTALPALLLLLSLAALRAHSLEVNR